jgi:uncharacterized spore protein YtfJ
MDITPVKQLLASLSETFSQNAAIKKNVRLTDRNPGKTLIPVARLVLGFGGGSGRKNGDNKPAGVRNDGGGLGGWLCLKPIDIIEVTPAYTHFFGFHTWGYIALGRAIGWRISRFGSRSRW